MLIVHQRHLEATGLCYYSQACARLAEYKVPRKLIINQDFQAPALEILMWLVRLSQWFWWVACFGKQCSTYVILKQPRAYKVPGDLLKVLVLSQWPGAGLRFCISNKLPYDVSVAGLLTALGAVSVGYTLKPTRKTASGVRLGHQEITSHSQVQSSSAYCLAPWWEQCFYRNGTQACSGIGPDMSLTPQHGFVAFALSRGPENAWRHTECTEDSMFRGIPVEPPVASFQGLPAEGEM